MNIHQKINAKGNVITWRSHITPKRMIAKNYKQPYEGMFSPTWLEPKDWRTNQEYQCRHL